MAAVLSSFFVYKHYNRERKRINSMLQEAEEKIINSLLVIDYEGDESTRNSNALRNKMNRIMQKQAKQTGCQTLFDEEQ